MLGLIEEYASRLKTRKSGTASEVWDTFRKKWVALQPEEFVRQVMLTAWQAEGRLEGTRVVVEKAVLIEGKNLRFDAALMRGTEVWAIIEFKSPEETLSEPHLLQLARYNTILAASWIILSNGLESRFYQRLSNGYQQVSGWEEVK